MKVTLYKVNADIVLCDKLLLLGDRIYIENYDPVNGKRQRVFLYDRTLIGTISSDFYWKLEKELQKLG
jgi:hypothetical protein